MPEYPDLEVYLDALRQRVQGQTLQGIRLTSPFLLRTVSPALSEFHGKRVESLSRLGKRLVFGFEGEYFLVLHLMIAGRLQWKASGTPISGKIQLAAFDFASGALILTEAGTKKRASLQALRGLDALQKLNPGGLEAVGSNLADFTHRIRSENHTLKRSLTDPRLFSGIGNAYSDEILHRSQLSPVQLTSKMDDASIARLHQAVQGVMLEWKQRLQTEAKSGFPTKVTAFHPEMAVHGRYGKPCPVCGEMVQRIRYAENETDYCPKCQNQGRLLADRALSRLLGADWPKTAADLEEKWSQWGMAKKSLPDPDEV